MRRKIIIPIIICCIWFIWTSYIGGGRLPIRIYIVASYSPTNICSRPQIQGFLDKLGEYKKVTDTQYIIRINYLNSRKISKEELNIKVKALMTTIFKFHPDYIVCFDDTAFEQVGLKLASKYYVLASGINMPLDEYKKKYPNINYKNIYIVEEYIQLDKLFRMLYESLYPDLLYKVFIIKSATNIRNKTESIILTQLIKELDEKEIKYQTLTISSIEQLREINKHIPKDALVFETILQLPGMSAEETIKQISSNLSNHVLIGFNPYFCRIGFSICTSVSFYGMGKLLGESLIKLSRNKSPAHKVKGPTYLIINALQLDKLGLDQLINKNQYVNGITSNRKQSLFSHE